MIHEKASLFVQLFRQTDFLVEPPQSCCLILFDRNFDSALGNIEQAFGFPANIYRFPHRLPYLVLFGKKFASLWECR